ncbi:MULTISPECIES: CheR family methyltransferase [Xanthomonas]|uniref:Chemotaxis protein methyltransferase n=1 Tax=Xanthomonas rydalmerensis TaxID=3046274 RepID=A0ABZ0JPG1_9XANT|nr:MULTISPECIES: protein-glutamate O-methyltransferase CheR [unclassified Xanthomonas]MBB5875302.1 chemotaxis protein methyltransferase CheR [Xanthomonas sp. 3498]MBB5944175.1 chemotaxis protein methyltransferase CheR [Xanthomonas sp. 3307]MXV06958.1 protein-glutamate O-methyltransferase CheR [Xanthomonas sp. LMG 9002]WOS41665.1 protein-glutamate O-methyltransferase CheR [Xanthomonas sp. DM-2023]WOS45851.1 protein-glutamate O-methyltransferase CheR [Xanthomonas sp. DM-2023]
MSMSLSDADFHKFREFFYRKTGIRFDDSKRYFVDKRLLDRIRDTDSGDFRNYFVTLRFEASGQELQTLTNLMTVNETYFFREEYQFRCLVRSLMEEIVARKTDRKPIRIWSLPSSSGEEPYSIALYLLEYWNRINDWDVEIIASDIDTAILRQAQQGLFSARSIQHLPPSVLQRYFEKQADGFQLCDDVRDAVRFTRVNLMDADDVRGHDSFDVVFCRNLLIYFDDLSRRRAAETFYEALVPGGFVCLGHSESMSRISSLFRVRKFPEAIVYQKPLEDR